MLNRPEHIDVWHSLYQYTGNNVTDQSSASFIAPIYKHTHEHTNTHNKRNGI